MIRKFTLLVLVSISLGAWSQQDGYQTHFQFNEMSYNPSYAGKVKDKMCVSMLLHYQYVGFKSELIKNSKEQPEVQPYNIGVSTQFLNISARLWGKLGVALNVINDKIGPQSYVLPKLSLSYYAVFKNTSELSAGFYFGMMQKSLDGTKLKSLSYLQDPASIPDPLVPTTTVKSNLMNDLGVGLHYFNPMLNNLNIGVAAAHLLTASVYLPNSKIPFTSITMHSYGNAAMDFDVGSSGDWVLQPNLLFKYGAKMQLDFNVLAYYQQQYYLGLSFRQGDNINLMVGYVQGDFKVGYAFDFIVNGLKPGSRTSHEIFIQYCKGIKTKDKVYRYILNPRHLKDSNY